MLAGSRDTAVASVVSAMQANGWIVESSTATSVSLGWSVRAGKGDTVAIADIGTGESSPKTAPALHPVEGFVHVSISVEST